MVASISARKNVSAAAAYYQHMGKDYYYARDSEEPGRWEGRAAERLSLEGSVSKSEFEAALEGRDPKTGATLLLANRRGHAAGWDVTFSAPKSVSVLWALSPENDRPAIEAAHQKAVRTATTFLENNAAWARRGRGGKIRERTAGLLIAAFDHHTSRDLDPQLHTHAFIFNLAPRNDGSWGAIVSRDLYRAQREAGLVYRAEFANELEKYGVEIAREDGNFRANAIPKTVERAFSKRRNAIEKAAEKYGYSSPKGMEMAALRTRKPKQSMRQGELFEAWRDEAKALGFALKQVKIRNQETVKFRTPSAAPAAIRALNSHVPAARANQENAKAKTLVKVPAPPNPGQLIRQLASALDGPSRMSGIRISLRDKQKTLERE